MPSITTTNGYTFNNWGPLTTTFTAPASCATATGNFLIGLNRTAPVWGFAVQCSTLGYSDCIPTGTASQITLDPNPNTLYQQAYYSPGLYCPSGWATFGVAERNTDKSLTSSGVLSLSKTVAEPSFVPQWENPLTLLMDLLDLNETLVMCCPSSMTADLNLGCYSTVSDYKVSAGCMRQIPASDIGESMKTYIVNGTTSTQLLNVITATGPETVTTTTFNAAEASQLVGLSVLPMVPLVHHKSDLRTTGTSTFKSTGAAATSNSATRAVAETNVWKGAALLCGASVAAAVLNAADLF